MSPEKQFEVGQNVLVRKKRPAFYKNSPIFFPSYEPNLYIVRSICKQYIPYKYYLEQNGNPAVKKQLYAFEMTKTSSTSNDKLSSKPLTIDKSRKVYVEDIIRRNKTTLRSGKEILGKDLIFYRITVDDKQDIVPESSLRLLKQALGGDAITYSNFFKQNNLQYVI